MVTAAHRLGNAWSEGPSTEAVPEATGAQRKVLDEMEVEDDERLLALWEVAVVYEQHSLMQDAWGNRCSFRRIVQSLLEVLRT